MLAHTPSHDTGTHTHTFAAWLVPLPHGWFLCCLQLSAVPCSGGFPVHPPVRMPVLCPHGTYTACRSRLSFSRFPSRGGELCGGGGVSPARRRCLPWQVPVSTPGQSQAHSGHTVKPASGTSRTVCSRSFCLVGRGSQKQRKCRFLCEPPVTCRVDCAC